MPDGSTLSPDAGWVGSSRVEAPGAPGPAFGTWETTTFHLRSLRKITLRRRTIGIERKSGEATGAPSDRSSSLGWLSHAAPPHCELMKNIAITAPAVPAANPDFPTPTPPIYFFLDREMLQIFITYLESMLSEDHPHRNISHCGSARLRILRPLASRRGLVALLVSEQEPVYTVFSGPLAGRMLNRERRTKS